MINPCSFDNKYIQYNPKYNLPTYRGNRYQLDYIKPTFSMFQKHKNLLLNHTQLTNGPGIVRLPSSVDNVSYKLNVDSVQYKNIIYKLPCNLRPYIKEIQSLLDQGSNIKQTIQYIIDKFDIPDIILDKNIYQNKRLYTYPYIDIGVPENSTNIINTDASFKIGELVENVDLQPIMNDLILNDSLFLTPQYTTIIYVSNNDNLTFTNNFNDLLPNGSASFFGSYLLSNYVESNDKWNIRLYIDPNEPPFQGSYGYLIDSSKYNLNTGLIFIPLQSFESVLLHKPYKLNLPITIRNTNNQSGIKLIDVVPCKYSETLNLVNSVNE